MTYDILASCLLVTFTGYQTVMTPNISFRFVARLQHLLYVLFELFIYCWRGEELKTEVYCT